MHHRITHPVSSTRDRTGNAKTAPPPSALPPGVRREAAIAYQRLANDLPRGLHRALRQMIESLVAAADGRPIGMFSDLMVEVTPSRVLVGPTSDDPVVYGIQRRFTVRATQTCHCCERNGRARPELGGRVRCARCAAPALLLQTIDQVLNQACEMLRINDSVELAALPPLLRSVFRVDTDLHSQIAQGNSRDMSCAHFKASLESLRAVASAMLFRQSAT